jgi:hypothetical protein
MDHPGMTNPFLLPGWLLRLRDGGKNNNPPTGDLEVDFRCSPTVEPDLGEKEKIPLLVLVTFPPIAEIPVF